jgi:hypothetical protein
MQRSGRRTAVASRDTNEQILRSSFGVFDENVEVAVLVEYSSVQQLVLKIQPTAATVGLHQVGIGIRRLRILEEILHVRMGRRALDVKVVLFDVFAVIPLTVGQSEEPFLQDGIFSIPEDEGKTEELSVIRDTRQSIFPPAISPGTSLVMGKILPCISGPAIILTDCSPLALAQIGTPLLPRGVALS